MDDHLTASDPRNFDKLLPVLATGPYDYGMGSSKERGVPYAILIQQSAGLTPSYADLAVAANPEDRKDE